LRHRTHLFCGRKLPRSRESGNSHPDSSGGRPTQVSEQRFGASGDVTAEVLDCAEIPQVGRTSARKGWPNSEIGRPSDGEEVFIKIEES
jgi:hypothetical protein